MRKAIILQAVVVLVATAIAAALFGPRSASSLLLGGLAYLVPNALFVAALSGAAGGRTGLSTQAEKQAATLFAGGFFAGELLKIAATLAILVGAHFAVANLQWLALLAGLFFALKANLLALLLKT